MPIYAFFKRPGINQQFYDVLDLYNEKRNIIKQEGRKKQLPVNNKA